MKKASTKTTEDDLRPDYKTSDFRGPGVRGKYAQRLELSTNIVVLRPEVAAAFPNDAAVNDALMMLLKLARASTRKSG